MAFYTAFAVAATIVYLTVPAAYTPVWAAIGLSSAGAVLLGVRMHRPAHRWPWYVLAGALLTFTAGDTYYSVLVQYLDATVPFPSPSDAFYLLTYPLLALGLYGLARYRWAGHDLPALLDALLLTAGLALPVWVFLVQPLTRTENMTWVQRAVSLAYPLGDVLVLLLLARLVAAGPGARGNRSLQLLLVGTLALLGVDVTYGILRLNGAWEAGTALDVGWIVFHAAWALAALHPSMAELTALRPREPSLLPARPRLVMLGLATLSAPVVLLHEALSGGTRDGAAIAAFSGLMFLLVLLRLGGMVVAHRTAVAREQTLRTATAALVAAQRPQDIEAACDRAVSTLFGPDAAHASALVPAVPDAGPDSWPAATRVVSVADLGPAAAARLRGLDTALACPMVPPDRPPGGDLPGLLVAAGPLKRLTEIRGPLESLAAHAGLAMERIGLREEISRRESEAYFRTLVSNASDVILIVDDDNTVRYASPSARAVFGGTEPTGSVLPDLVGRRDRERARQALDALRAEGAPETHDHWWVTRDSGRTEVEVRCSDLRGDPTVAGIVVTLRDVTEQRQLEQELTQRAFHDALTGLPNRTLLLERVERALLRGRREPALTCLLFIDLDDFKMVNDTLGHPAGDLLLMAVGERLSGTLRRTDTAARLGGDEFAVLMEDAREPVDAELLAAQILQTLSRPVRLLEDSVSVSASVGVATALDSANADELLQHADLALYAAKAAGKRQWRRFRPPLHDRVVRRHELQERMDAIVGNGGFALRYQPVVDLATEEVVGFEALLRWPDDPRGTVPTEQFVALAEETGQIASLGAWVLRNAAAGAARLQATTSGPAPYISVNVSARQFREADFVDQVRAALDTPGLRPGSLQLELTETVLMRRDKQIDAVVQRVKDLGVRIAVDDFGTGFSGLRYLREFPVDVLKIDKSYVDDITVDTRQFALVEGIVRIARTLGLDVIAEGIETPEQWALLTSMDCRFGQGFLFARPLVPDQAAALLDGPAPGRRP
ncbi:putative bifunctional diguanylate cyclase/phosphodiesterase [Streptomyces xanthii]|uniref:EAL domain-containing protein n=1 Tax=Streptomyces xanthii TaxID=2768069 RepID=A0A7H1BGN6_9ACTN|nr:EAL domain-containing protein [Streptomyces xanthii]QNS07891.1 EAL domain-containing protein [Streptomyces xanthii]